MTTDKALDELIAWIQSKSVDYPAVDTWTIRKSGDAREKGFPLVVLEAVSADEHEVLRGVYSPLTIEARLETIPHEDGSTAAADTISTHEADALALWNILADEAAIEWIDARGTVRCFDIRGSEGTLETDDDLRVTSIEVRMICSIF